LGREAEDLKEYLKLGGITERVIRLAIANEISSIYRLAQLAKVGEGGLRYSVKKNTWQKPETLQKIAEYFNIGIDWLITGKDSLVFHTERLNKLEEVNRKNIITITELFDENTRLRKALIELTKLPDMKEKFDKIPEKEKPNMTLLDNKN
jgi:transcriptional regulator with XRE-family HTH domain